MKKFIATSSGFEGEVHIVYNDDGVLMFVDFSFSNIEPEGIQWIKDRTPVKYTSEWFHKSFNTDRLTFVEESFHVDFEMFWKRYNHKINKKRCVDLWNKMGKTQQVKAYFGITAYVNYLNRTGYRNKKDPENYLRNKMWETDWSKAA